MKRVRLVLGHQQARVLLAAASRGIDEWAFELGDGEVSLQGSAADYRLAQDAYRKVLRALEDAR